MKTKHYLITLTENISVKEASGEITRNSNGTQWIDVELDGWKLGEGEALYITFELENEEEPMLTTRVGPLHLILDCDTGRYVTQAPPEVLSVAGEWKYSIEKRLNIVEVDDELTYDTITSSVETLQIVDSIMRATLTDKFVKEGELLIFESLLTNNIETAMQAKDEAKQAQQKAEFASEQAEEAKNNAELALENTEKIYEETKQTISEVLLKPMLVWGFNEAVDISELEWEVQ